MRVLFYRENAFEQSSENALKILLLMGKFEEVFPTHLNGMGPQENHSKALTCIPKGLTSVGTGN